MSIENIEDKLDGIVLEDVAEAAQKLADDATPALLKVLRGNPEPEELAALVAVVTAAAGNGNGNGEPTGPLEYWGDKSQALNTRGRYSFAPRAFVNGELGQY
ncbi:acyl-CoA carboxylase epsilon subunit [Tomitella biformata]|uniref:acyl-CoA carboxylase epsilon subunit n=1 Tax=Tomitella biformata TaxID=630403 RepID=UPI0004B348E5|nr:acyl-CoA carboxylase epsilon subunit [Tomitella biformata]